MRARWITVVGAAALAAVLGLSGCSAIGEALMGPSTETAEQSTTASEDGADTQTADPTPAPVPVDVNAVNACPPEVFAVAGTAGDSDLLTETSLAVPAALLEFVPAEAPSCVLGYAQPGEAVDPHRFLIVWATTDIEVAARFEEQLQDAGWPVRDVYSPPGTPGWSVPFFTWQHADNPLDLVSVTHQAPNGFIVASINFDSLDPS